MVYDPRNDRPSPPWQTTRKSGQFKKNLWWSLRANKIVKNY